MGKELKVLLFAVALVVSGYFLGAVCGWMMRLYDLLLDPSWQILYMLLWFLAAAAAMIVCGAMVAVLVRPLWVSICIFVSAGVAMVAGMGITAGTALLCLIFLAGAGTYVMKVAAGFEDRVRFSLRPLKEGQGILLLAICLAACGCIYFGSRDHIQREGFAVPEHYIESFSDELERRVESQVPDKSDPKVAAAMNDFRLSVRDSIDRTLEQNVVPYGRYVPFFVAFLALMVLSTAMQLVGWIMTGALKILFHLLNAAGVTRINVETREVQRLVIS